MKVIGLFVFLGVLFINDFAEARRNVSTRGRQELRSEADAVAPQRSRAARRARRVASVVVEPSQASQQHVPPQVPEQTPPAEPPAEVGSGSGASLPPSASSGNPANSNPESCVAANRPSARCENAFHTTFSLMLIGMCRLEDHGYTASTFNVRRDQGCLRLRCLETELAEVLNSRGCSGEIIEWFSTITEYDYSNEVCVTRPNTSNALNHCEL